MEGPEHYCRTGTPHCAPEKADHFVVEDLLDFSKEGEEGGDDWGFDAAAGTSTDDSSIVTAVECCSNSLSGCGPHLAGDLAFRSFADAGLPGDLCGPHEELAELEWLSNFVEESFSSEDLLHKPQPISGGNLTTSSSSAATIVELSAHAASAQPSLFRPEVTIPAKARSKRSRAAPCSWSSRLLVFSPSSAVAASSPESELISQPSAAPEKKATKLAKKADLAVALAPSEGRRCLHCQAEKTPQWRAGPMGPKTLCNACGVRYKSGRLVPEYRPAASPTFVPSKHSNSHRKVLELRRQKEFQRQQLLRDDNGGAAGDGGYLYRHMGPGLRQVM